MAESFRKQILLKRFDEAYPGALETVNRANPESFELPSSVSLDMLPWSRFESSY